MTINLSHKRRKNAGPLVGLRFACPTLLLLLFIGCGRQGPERVLISGTVTYQGSPLKEGQIRFAPAGGTKAPVSITPIIDGRYAVTAHGGVAVGTYKIEIMAYRQRKNSPTASDQKDFPGASVGGPPVEQFIPENYNKKSELTITIPSGSGAITKNFDLTD